jgi:hypothetical protein
MTITKETAYKYLKDTGALNEYTDDFFISGFHINPPKNGVNTHAIVNCGYMIEDYPYTIEDYPYVLQYKNIYIRDIDYKRWVRDMRLRKLNEVL